MMKAHFSFFATAPKGLARLLEDELNGLGAQKVRRTQAGASFKGDLELAYRVCLWSRIANRILFPQKAFSAKTPEALYNGIKKIDWDTHLAVSGTFAVDVNLVNAHIHHSQYAVQKVKDAVVDQFIDRSGRRPSVNIKQPHIRINVYIESGRATVSLDLSGDSLHRRGYRKSGVQAPLKENLAAALLKLAGWPEIVRNGGGLIDPMCGSGTLPIEAALMGADIAPGLMREYFGFLHWKQFAPHTWKGLKEEALARRKTGLQKLPMIVGCDSDPRAVRAANANLDRTGLQKYVHFERQDLSECTPHPRIKQHSGLIILNPPYGQRITHTDIHLKELYAKVGRLFKDRFIGWKGAVLTNSLDLAKQMAIRSNKIYTLYNGAMTCKLLNFDLERRQFLEPRKEIGGLRMKARKSPESSAFLNRLKKNQKKLSLWLKKEDISCYRLYDRDIPEYAVAVDIYGDRILVQEYAPPKTINASKARIRLKDILSIIHGDLGFPPNKIFLKERRRQKGKWQYERQGEKGIIHEIREHGLTFYVNFSDYLDSGIFLDQREIRRRIRLMAAGKRFLNLFAYTGTATVYAAKGGARATTSVDLSATYLDWAKKNMKLNGFTGKRHEFIKADCLTWIQNKKRKYGLIYLAPPTFSNSKAMARSFDVQRDHEELIHSAGKLLDDSGILIFCSNYRKFKLHVQALSEFKVENITDSTIPKDFSRNRHIHTCWLLRKAGPSPEF